ncbi:MAG TPA: ammonium transporter [Tepidisphaeraceae bacterium]|nr:ammonium transporter [Tepidisphaeraceae bacterium]
MGDADRRQSDRNRPVRRWWRSGLLGCTVAFLVALSVAVQQTNAQTTAPATQPAAAAAPAATLPLTDPSGANGGSNSLIAPNSTLPGWQGGGTDSAGNYHNYSDAKGNPTDTPNPDWAPNVSKAFFSINFVWTLVCGYLVMFMQAGFALVETGLVRGKNAAHTMSMNFLIYAIGMFGFFVCGFAFMCGGANGVPTNVAGYSTFGPGQLGGIPALSHMFYLNIAGKPFGLIGLTGFFLHGPGYDAAAAVWFLFEMVFMDTTATIVTGGCAERWSMKSFFVFSMFVGAVTYPIFGCWVWGGGWLAQLGVNFPGLGNGACDYAGSGVVHLQGGVLALVGAWMLGPRLGKWDKNGKLVNPVTPHNIPMVMLGSFILAFGWFGFNPGSSLAASDNRIGIVATNTMLAGMSATLSACLYMWWFGPTKKPDPAMMCNGLLAGLVAITAPSGFVSPDGAFWIGAIAGVLVCLSVFFFDKIHIDDPVGAISVHGTCGAWGVLAVGLFADGTSYSGYNNVSHTVCGLFYGAHPWGQLGANFIEVVANITWNVVAGGFFFWLTGKLVGGNRVSAKIEIAGLDMPEMGAMGYPETTPLVLPSDITDAQVAAITAGEMLDVPALQYPKKPTMV